MKSLIINADDAGLSDGVNDAIKACYLAGSITGTSIMPCGRCFKEAAAMLRDIKKIETGVHLTLTGNCFPSTRDNTLIKTILNKDGRFIKNYMQLGERLLFRKIDLSELYLELSNQVKVVIDEGLTITHLDSHEHIHMFREVLDVTLKLAEEFNIPYIRFPVESLKVMKEEFSPKDLIRSVGLKVFTSMAKKNLMKKNIKVNDNFLGHFHSGRINDKIMCSIVDGLEEGISELAVHPAVLTKELLEESPWHKNSQNELEVLLKGSWKEKLGTGDIQLISHKEASN